MIFELEIADRVRTVEIRRHSGGYVVKVDGRPRLVDAVHVTGCTWSLLVHDVGRGTIRSVDATVIDDAHAAGIDVHVNGVHFPVRLTVGGGRQSRDRHSHAGRVGGPQRVTAPMPGKVVRVLVTPGALVASGQGLVIVEAMKMENELRAAREGVVREVLVTEGQSVEAGAALVVVN